MPTVVKPDIIAEYKIHEKDTGSSEVQIALLTNRITELSAAKMSAVCRALATATKCG